MIYLEDGEAAEIINSGLRLSASFGIGWIGVDETLSENSRVLAKLAEIRKRKELERAALTRYAVPH